MAAGAGVRGCVRRHPRADGLRRWASAAQPDRVGGSAGVAAVPAAGVVGDRAAGAVVGAGQHAAVAVQLHGLRSAGVPARRDARRPPGHPMPMPRVDVRSVGDPRSRAGRRVPDRARSPGCHERARPESMLRSMSAFLPVEPRRCGTTLHHRRRRTHPAALRSVIA